MDNNINNINNKIINSCLFVNQNSKNVKINDDAIESYIYSNLNFFQDIPTWTPCHFDPNKYELEYVISYICIIDSLNFCFWPYESKDNEFEYFDLVNSLNNLLQTDLNFFNSDSLINLTKDDLMLEIFPKNFPLIEERTRSLNELGFFIKKNFDGKFLNFIINNNYNIEDIVFSISSGVTTFRDESLFLGRQVFLYKRSQILASDLYSALKELSNPIILLNSNSLTMFADYRIPQILRELNIISYSNELEQIINNKDQILPNSIYEIEIRANTIICVEKLKKILKEKYNFDILSLHIDYVLWNEGEKLRKKLKPHHRVLSIFY